jgi:hypothetical protein
MTVLFFSLVTFGLFPVIFGLVFLFVIAGLVFITVPLGFNPGIQKTQGRASRYVHRKQRASTKVRTAAIDAVKLATACALQRRFIPQPLMRSSWLQLVNPFFCRHILQRDNQLLVQSVTDVEQTA